MNPWSAAKFLIGLIVVGLVLYCVWLLLGLFHLPEPFPTIIMIVFFLIALGYLWAYGDWRPPPPP